MKLFACVLPPTSLLEVCKCETGFLKIILFFRSVQPSGSSQSHVSHLATHLLCQAIKAIIYSTVSLFSCLSSCPAIQAFCCCQSSVSLLSHPFPFLSHYLQYLTVSLFSCPFSFPATKPFSQPYVSLFSFPSSCAATNHLFILATHLLAQPPKPLYILNRLSVQLPHFLPSHTNFLLLFFNVYVTHLLAKPSKTLGSQLSVYLAARFLPNHTSFLLTHLLPIESKLF